MHPPFGNDADPHARRSGEIITPQDAETLRLRLGLHTRASCDFFDALVAIKFLERRQGEYSNTPATDFYLDRNKPTYAGGILERKFHFILRQKTWFGPYFSRGLRTSLIFLRVPTVTSASGTVLGGLSFRAAMSCRCLALGSGTRQATTFPLSE